MPLVKWLTFPNLPSPLAKMLTIKANWLLSYFSLHPMLSNLDILSLSITMIKLKLMSSFFRNSGLSLPQSKPTNSTTLVGLFTSTQFLPLSPSTIYPPFFSPKLLSPKSKLLCNTLKSAPFKIDEN